MDVHALTLLVEILDAGNLSEAARRLKMTRANVSYHLNSLERSIGQQLVRRTCQGGGVGLGGADVHAAIDQRRVDADDLERKAFDQADRQRGLARGGRPHQENGRGMAGC